MKQSTGWAVVLALMATTGCLTTRAELRELEGKRTQVSAAQEVQAQATARMEEYDQQFRALNGRLDVVENQLTQINAGHADRTNQEQRTRQELDLKFRAYEDALKKLEGHMAALEEELREVKSRRAKEAPEPASQASAKDAFKAAEEAFEKKDYKRAIVEYEAYRKASPKGKSYAAATLKIGMSFHELGMRDEAKAFFEEVVAKFPGSGSAKKASQRLKAMK